MQKLRHVLKALKATEKSEIESGKRLTGFPFWSVIYCSHFIIQARISNEHVS